MTAASPRLLARVAGAFYLITIVTAVLALRIGGNLGTAANLVAAGCYVVVTLLLYELLKPVNGRIALLAVFFSIVGTAVSSHGLAFYGVYCILTGYLIYESTFLPRLLAVLMVLAGLGLLGNTFVNLLAPALGTVISPFAIGVDGIGEIALTLWLLVFGLNVPNWEAQAKRAPSLA